MASATPRPARTKRAAKRIVRRTAAKTAAARRTVAPLATHRARRIGIISLIAVGTLVALGAAAMIAAAVDPRAEELLRRGWRDARNAVDDLPSRLPEVSLGRLESLAGQIAELGQRLGSFARATASRF
jgi:hypothetical protein